MYTPIIVLLFWTNGLLNSSFFIVKSDVFINCEIPFTGLILLKYEKDDATENYQNH